MQTRFRHPKRNPDGSFWQPKPRGRKPTACGDPVVSEDGTIRWYYKRKLHREDGLPAIEKPDGSKYYYYMGRYMGAEDVPAPPPLSDDDEKVVPCVDRDGTTRYEVHGMLHRARGPAWIHWSGAQKWYKGGVLHRDDGPAWIVPRLFVKYYKNGCLHRKDGPAVIHAQGTMEWVHHGRRLYSRTCVHPPDRPVLCLVPMATIEEAERSAASIVGDDTRASRCLDALYAAPAALYIPPGVRETSEGHEVETTTNFIPGSREEGAV